MLWSARMIRICILLKKVSTSSETTGSQRPTIREEVPQDDSRDLSMQLEHIIKESERNRNIWDKMKAMPSEMDNLLLRECEDDFP